MEFQNAAIIDILLIGESVSSDICDRRLVADLIMVFQCDIMIYHCDMCDGLKRAAYFKDSSSKLFCWILNPYLPSCYYSNFHKCMVCFLHLQFDPCCFIIKTGGREILPLTRNKASIRYVQPR